MDYLTLTVKRKSDYYFDKMMSSFLNTTTSNDDVLHLFVGDDGENKHLIPYKNHPRFIFHHPHTSEFTMIRSLSSQRRMNSHTDEYAIIKNLSSQKRMNWNYQRCLSFQNDKHPLVIWEDDIEFCVNWQKHLERIVADITRKYGEDFILGLMTSKPIPKTELGYSVCKNGTYDSIPVEILFFSSQGIYWPYKMRLQFADYLEKLQFSPAEYPKNWSGNDSMYDELLAKYITKKDIKAFVCIPCLCNHLGSTCCSWGNRMPKITAPIEWDPNY